MALTTKTLDSRELATSLATIYTVPGATATRVTEIIVNNNDSGGAARTFTLHFVNSGGAGDDTNKVFFAVDVDPTFPLILPMNTWMDTGDFIAAFASGLDVSIHISGIEES